MQTRRRHFLKLVCAVLASGCGALLRPVSALAADWNKKGFEARSLADVLKSLNAGSPAGSKSIQLKMPEIADDDTDVPIFVASKIPNTQMIAVIVENNIHPLAASFLFSNGADPAFSAHLKVRRTSRIAIAVQADGKYFLASKEVKVAAANCAP
ncbi:MAG: thiosulfate oxidation carrier protein SoxY [Betaproteobacteria bacterium]|nr:MAG: thiosulfate oxidation carrier protein SoxY [Betaproteobacteria bacterium]